MADVTITLTLTEDEWCEVVNAVASKSTQIANGNYGEEESPGDDEKWINDLDSAYDKLTKAVDAKGVVY
jgi:hypothetical protein